ncbi:hypothetical protein TSOC111612_21185 [Tsukamurella ocularis]
MSRTVSPRHSRRSSGSRASTAQTRSTAIRSAAAGSECAVTPFSATQRAPTPSPAPAMASCRATATSVRAVATRASRPGASFARDAVARSRSVCAAASRSFAVPASGPRPGTPVIDVCGHAGPGRYSQRATTSAWSRRVAASATALSRAVRSARAASSSACAARTAGAVPAARSASARRRSSIAPPSASMDTSSPTTSPTSTATANLLGRAARRPGPAIATQIAPPRTAASNARTSTVVMSPPSPR